MLSIKLCFSLFAIFLLLISLSIELQLLFHTKIQAFVLASFFLGLHASFSFSLTSLKHLQFTELFNNELCSPQKQLFFLSHSLFLYLHEQKLNDVALNICTFFHRNLQARKDNLQKVLDTMLILGSSFNSLPSCYNSWLMNHISSFFSFNFDYISCIASFEAIFPFIKAIKSNFRGCLHGHSLYFCYD